MIKPVAWRTVHRYHQVTIKHETTYDYIGSLAFRPNEPKMLMYL